MVSVRITVDSESLGDVEVTQVSSLTFYDYKMERSEIRDLVVKATENIYGAYGVPNDEPS